LRQSPVASPKISLDVEGGVKFNDRNFGDLVAEVRAVCGTNDEE
jgi:hypothetical protein